MIRINQLKLPVTHTRADLENRIGRKLKLSKNANFTFEIIRRSVDARKKPEIFYSYTIDVTIEDESGTGRKEQLLGEKLKDAQITVHQPVRYCFPYFRQFAGEKPFEPEEGSEQKNFSPMKILDFGTDSDIYRDRPVIVGMGPAGLFCGYMLAIHGFRPIILERGEGVEAREITVEKFWREGILNPESNVQFGEGGAGTFSDGKLNTLVKDKDGRGRAVLSILVEAGAPEQILYDYKPHIGTDILKKVVRRMRKSIIAHGGEVRFGKKVTGFLRTGNQLTGVVINGQEKLLANQVVLAIGHSARDTFQVLYDAKIPIEAKAFAVGLRVEHPQAVINRSQYGTATHDILEAASYKVVSGKTNPAVYSFCMCPGGYVVNASSEDGRTAINGMSYSDRQGSNANSAIVATVAPEDYGMGHPLSGIAFQRQLEEKAYAVGKGKIPVEYYHEFKRNVLKKNAFGNAKDSLSGPAGILSPSMKGAWCFAPVHEILPPALNRALVSGMTEFGRMIQGFDDDTVLVSGVESRTSSPVRILRDESLQSTIQGLFPCGEGAGYAGGIMSAAMDGIRVAEAVAGSCVKGDGKV